MCAVTTHVICDLEVPVREAEAYRAVDSRLVPSGPQVFFYSSFIRPRLSGLALHYGCASTMIRARVSFLRHRQGLDVLQVIGSVAV